MQNLSFESGGKSADIHVRADRQKRMEDSDLSLLNHTCARTASGYLRAVRVLGDSGRTRSQHLQPVPIDDDDAGQHVRASRSFRFVQEKTRLVAVALLVQFPRLCFEIQELFFAENQPKRPSGTAFKQRDIAAVEFAPPELESAP